MWDCQWFYPLLAHFIFWKRKFILSTKLKELPEKHAFHSIKNSELQITLPVIAWNTKVWSESELNSLFRIDSGSEIKK